MQCGLGWGDARFAAMGANIRTRPSAFEEALDIVRRLLAGETVSSSRRFRIAETSLALRPAEPVEVWIGASAAGHRPRGKTGGGLDREPRPHPRGGARAGRTLS
jgi:alkanesulfonate monooxygenase SsuD/methylene tetrahydromethanopterin reductase-like flavin-dependent oxidoreductase (luciferase family)